MEAKRGGKQKVQGGYNKDNTSNFSEEITGTVEFVESRRDK